jgi:3-dehydrocarnitine:acetyl-CoA trimethylamine transferase
MPAGDVPMNPEVIITCAVTGDDTKVTKSPHCPVTPVQIAASAVEAARAGAAIVHIHVRDPATGAFSMATEHYREVVKNIRASGVDVIVNLTCGMGGYIYVGDKGMSDTPAPGTDFVSQEERMRHVIELCHEGKYRPEIATLDCGSLNFGDTNRAYVSTPNYLRKGAAILRDLGVKPELEIFDTGNLWFVHQLVKEGLIDAPALIQLCAGIPWGVPADVGHLLAMVTTLPAGSIWTSFAISRMQMPWVAQSILLGGNVRVGLEDNLYLSRGVYASNAQLVTRAVTIIEAMGAKLLAPAAVRERLKLH